ncbi:MAG: hypothetical protein V4534_01530 [Myxococcota bacterium]
MKTWQLASFTMFLISCSGNEDRETLAVKCVGDAAHVCIGENLQIKLDGFCNAAADCPAPYNSCQNSLCAKQPSSIKQYYWFATDPIRPGVSALCSAGVCTDTQDYIYNIMAKGYASLDDWCMSQAQQSQIPSMRNVAAWTALILAMPDNTATLSSSGQNRLSLFTDTGSKNYIAPNGIGFAGSITDKHSNQIKPLEIPSIRTGQKHANATIMWTGMGSTQGDKPAASYWIPGQGDPLCDLETTTTNWQVNGSYDPSTPSARGDQAASSNTNAWSSLSNSSLGAIAYFDSVDLSPCIGKAYQSVVFFAPGDSTSNPKPNNYVYGPTGNAACRPTSITGFEWMITCWTDFLIGTYTGEFKCLSNNCGSKKTQPFKPEVQIPVDATQQYGIVCKER